MRSNFILNILCVLFSSLVFAQTKIAITLDDVPNTRIFKANNYNSLLLNKLDSLKIPIAIFVNEGLVYKQDSKSKNVELLEKWIKKEYITLGNHTFSHLKYSDVGFDEFRKDIIKGEPLLKELAKKYEKPVNHFRFPYNDLGMDSLQQLKIDNLLKSRDYISTPFTVESADWMYNFIYRHYISEADFEKANEIGKMYVDATIDYFVFFDSLSLANYGRKINQIFLCHDNTLNTVYLDKIIDSLNKMDFQFISIDEAMKDKVYQNKSFYHNSRGISWMYRWMKTDEIRREWMKNEPDITFIEELFEELYENK